MGERSLFLKSADETFFVGRLQWFLVGPGRFAMFEGADAGACVLIPITLGADSYLGFPFQVKS